MQVAPIVKYFFCSSILFAKLREGWREGELFRSVKIESIQVHIGIVLYAATHTYTYLVQQNQSSTLLACLAFTYA